MDLLSLRCGEMHCDFQFQNFVFRWIRWWNLNRNIHRVRRISRMTNIMLNFWRIICAFQFGKWMNNEHWIATLYFRETHTCTRPQLTCSQRPKTLNTHDNFWRATHLSFDIDTWQKSVMVNYASLSKVLAGREMIATCWIHFELIRTKTSIRTHFECERNVQ